MHPPEVSQRSAIIDLFAGPGGLDMAAVALEIGVTGIEINEDACTTRAAAGLETNHCDVRERGPSDYPDARILAGGPPCQTFTVAGSGAGRKALDQVLRFARSMDKGLDIKDELAGLDDERTGLVLEPLRWALEAIQMNIAYETIVLEQVSNVLPVWKQYAKILTARGYKVCCKILHTEEYGIPQTRSRAILIARRHHPAEMPAATHQRFRKHNGTPDQLFGSKLKSWMTMGEVLTERQKPFEMVSNYGTGGDPKARGRRTHEEPAFTVTGKISRNYIRTFCGSDRTRIRFEEAGLLQTFPASYPWSGRDIAQQIGNAIPPRLGIHILASALGLGSEDIESAIKRLETWEPPFTDSSTNPDTTVD